MQSLILTFFIAVLVALAPHVSAAGRMIMEVSDSRVGCVQWRDGDGRAVTVPVAAAGKTGGLRLVFDLLAPEGEDESWMPYLRCRVRHTDADGEDDGLIESEYLDGFNLADIGYGEASEPGVTTVLYRNYSVEVPPAEMKARLSGNYVLEVFEEGVADKTIIAAPFAIEEGSAGVAATVTSRTDTDWNGESQQLEIDVTAKDIDRRVGVSDLRIDIVQNGQEMTRRTIRHASRTVGMKAVYAHRPELVFKGGNEYRRMETVSRRTPGMNVAEIVWDNRKYHEILNTDSLRRGMAYAYDQTQGGEFTIREADESMTTPSDREADYTVVHFALEGSGIRPPDAVLVEGALTGRRTDDRAAMEYDEETDIWRKAMLLKQGAYDYRYMARNALTGETAGGAIEGDHHQTQNVYTVFVYYRVPGERTDRLAATATIKAEANR